MKQLTHAILILILFTAQACSQQVSSVQGTFPQLAGQWIKLEGFAGFNTYVIDSTKADNAGKFTLNYNSKNLGVGKISAPDNKSFMIILEPEHIKLQGETLASPQTITITAGSQNHLFGTYASEHPRREQALSAWDYLEKIYMADSLFSHQTEAIKAVMQEKQRIKTEDQAFLSDLNPDTFISWYLPLRKLVSSVSTIAQYRTQEIPATLSAFRAINYTDNNLWTSGLLAQTIESHFWLIENSGRNLDSVYIEMNTSIDRMMESLITDDKKLNEISEFLFKLLESRSLFGSSEYFALKLLNEQSGTLNADLAAQLESYRAMKKGNTAPDISFNSEFIATGYTGNTTPKKLSDIDSKYKIVIFGASWCPQCREELPKMAQFYPKWKSQGVEVVFISLDENKQDFKNFTQGYLFISYCDYKKWQSPAVKSYYVFATPTAFLLDKQNTIILRPNSVNHIDSWVDWFLVKGNKLN